MSHAICVTPTGAEEYEATLYISGDLSNFYNFFDAQDANQVTNGDGVIKTTVSKVKEFLETENKFPGKNTGETLLREFLEEFIFTTPSTELIIECS